MKDKPYYIEVKIFANDPEQMDHLVGQFEHIHYGIEHEGQWEGIICTVMSKNTGLAITDDYDEYIKTTNDLQLELLASKEQIDDLICQLNKIRNK